ncbi:TniQ family protein [Ruegeria arenilitoris]|uniref:TniQ family protein n=1 Tax=Ruegeria arenilitoris TaxID=1173585 RepID=UPI00147ADB6B|nr:TniQ family protein [Ruegeria arenilitoris]
MRSPLNPILPLIEGETPSGYVSRVARLYRTTPRDLCSDLGMRWPFLCSGHEDQLERLAWLTGQDCSALKLCSATKLAAGRYRVGLTHSSTGVFRRTASRFCPLCVSEARTQSGEHGIYELLEWKVLSLHRCDKHGVGLRTLPAAGHSHEAYDFATQAIKHWEVIEKAVADAIILPPIRFEDYVRERIRSGPQGDWLNGFDLTSLHGACVSLGAALEGFGARAAMSLDRSVTPRLAELGHSYMSDGPDGLSRALHLLHGNSRSERPYFSSDLGPFYEWLHDGQDDPILHEIRTKTREHIFETYPVPLDKDVLGQKPQREIWLTMEEARKRSGFGAVFLKKLLGYIEGISADDAMKRTDVRVTELAWAQAFWSELMNLSQAAKELSIRSEQVKVLMRLGVLTQVQVTSALRYARRQEIQFLLRRIGGLPDVTNDVGYLPLRTFCRSRGISLARVVAACLSGELEGQLRQGTGAGVHAIEVSERAFAQKDAICLERDLTLAETAKFLKISIISIRKLRNAGYLAVINKLNPDTIHIRTYVCRDSIRGFQARYATLGQIAVQRNVAPIHLARQLDREEISPISCDGSLVRVYDKEAVLPDGIWLSKSAIDRQAQGEGK